MRRRATSQPNPPTPRPPYTYTPLSSPRHIRLLRIISHDIIRGRVYVSLREYPIESVADGFTALSYTWDNPVEPFELKAGFDRSTPTTNPETPSPDTLELIVLPPESHLTFRRIDDLAPSTNRKLDIYTPPGIGRLPMTRRSNLSAFFRAYLVGFPERHMRPRPLGNGKWHNYTYEQVAHLWIDALCIDQSNSTQEKATQIPLMGEIYSRAARVLGWLGADRVRLRSFAWLHEVAYPAMRQFLGGNPYQPRHDRMTVLRSGNFIDDGFWRDVVGLRERPAVAPSLPMPWLVVWMEYWAFYRTRRYFQRAWIVQEIAVAKAFDVMVSMHGREISWADMTDLAHLLDRLGWPEMIEAYTKRILGLEYGKGMPPQFGVVDIVKLRHMLRFINSRSPDKRVLMDWQAHWLVVLSAVRARGCLYPQDKVFATLGILQQILYEERQVGLPVDATATPGDVYLSAAKLLLRNNKRLTVLSFADHPSYRNVSDLPSWVPDFSNSEHPNVLGDFTRFRAFPPLPARIPSRAISPAGQLRLWGFRLDAITTTGGRCDSDNGFGETVLALLASMPKLYPHKRAPGGNNTGTPTTDPWITPNGQHRVNVLIETLMGRDTQGGDMERLHVEFREWLYLELVIAYSKCLPKEAGGDNIRTNGEKKDRWNGIMASIQTLVSQAEEDDLTASIIPRLEDVRADGVAHGKVKVLPPNADPVSLPRMGAFWKANSNEISVRCRRTLCHRTLLKTVNGWVGFCTETCQPGDEIWLFEGGSVPYVLRREDNGARSEQDQGAEPPLYRFCGECYVHGVMEGELVIGREAEVEKQLMPVILV